MKHLSVLPRIQAAVLALSFFVFASEFCAAQADDQNSKFDQIAYRNSIKSKDIKGLEAEYEKEQSIWKDALAKVSQASDFFLNDAKSNFPYWAAAVYCGAEEGETARQKLFELVVRLTELRKKYSKSDREFLIANVRIQARTSQFQSAYRATEALIAAGDNEKETLFLSVLASRGVNEFANAQRRLAHLKAIGFRPRREGQKVFNNLVNMMPLLERAKQREKRFIEEDSKTQLPIAEIETSRGVIKVQLLENDAPNTVANFVTLAEQKFYDGLLFYDVSGAKAKIGSPKNASDGNSGFRIPLESGRKRPPLHGYLVMEVPASGQISSQFSIQISPGADLKNGMTAFGRIIEGIEVLDFLNRVQEKSSRPKDKIINIKVTNKRNHKYLPKVQRIH